MTLICYNKMIEINVCGMGYVDSANLA